MRHQTFFTTVAMCLLFAFTNTAFKPLPLLKPTLSSGNAHVNGGGTAMEGGEVSTFVFNAVENPDGTVSGHLNYQFRAGDNNIQVDITCLSITGNRATMAGTVTSLSGENLPVWMFEGAHVSFTVEDNGQGKNVDKISDLIFGSGTTCADNWNTYISIKGNIDIKE